MKKAQPIHGDVMRSLPHVQGDVLLGSVFEALSLTLSTAGSFGLSTPTSPHARWEEASKSE